MSDPDKDRPNCGGDEAEDGGGCWKAKKRFLFRLRKTRRRNKQPLGSNSCCVVGRNEKIGGCFMCLRKNPAEDFRVESNETRNCCSGYQVESLKSVMEKNDFFSKECNTHLDEEATSSCSGICGGDPCENDMEFSELEKQLFGPGNVRVHAS